jgi:succinoglycan biosynthesis transport protein ExoP
MIESSESEPDLNLAGVIQLVIRRRMLLFYCVLTALVLSIIYLAIAHPRYRADSELQILKDENPTTLTDSTVTPPESSDPLAVNLVMQTYVGVLESDKLALQVIQELDLEKTPEYRWKPGYMASEREKAEAGLPLDQTRTRREWVIRRFQKNLEVSVVSGSKLLSVGFYSVNPDLAGRVLSQLIKDFLDYNFGLRFSVVTQSEDWLNSQLGSLRDQVERAQEEAANLQRRTGIFGTDETHNLVLSRLESLDQELTSAEQNRIVKESVYNVVRGGDPEAISSLSTAVGQANTPGPTNSLLLVQTLRGQEANLTSQYADISSRYGPNFPRVTEVRDQLAAVKQAIAKELQRLNERAANDYKASVEQEDAIRKEWEEQKRLAVDSNDLAIQYTIANREATSTRDLYQHLLERSKEVGIISGMRSSNISVLDPAHTSAKPVSPRKQLVLALGLGAGLIFGLAIVFLWDSLDPALRVPDDLPNLARAPLLGTLPEFRGDWLLEPSANSGAQPISSANENRGAVYEVLRSIRTALLHNASARSLNTFVVTSPGRSEGKTAIALNLAAVLALQSKKVLLVDGDLRHGGLSKTLGLASAVGLSELVNAGAQVTPALLAGSQSVYFLPSGSLPALPTETLTSDAFLQRLASWRSEFDFVVIDTVAILPVTDAVSLSSKVGGVVLVALYGSTPKNSIAKAATLLTSAGAVILGTILNGADVKIAKDGY